MSAPKGFLAAASLAVLVSAALASGGPGRSLGGYPVCEASAAVIIRCPDVEGRCLLVGDNERRDALFLFPIEREGVDVASRRTLPFKPLLTDPDPDEREISDIEALAAIGDAEILIVGSHSRNKNCKSRENRRRMLGVTLGDDGFRGHPLWTYRQAKKPDCERMFSGKREALSPSKREVCTAVEIAELAADAARTIEACEAAQPFNVEGAVAVPSDDGGPSVWFGLRAPLVRDRAVLLRRSRPAATGFDAVAFVDAGGSGIRDLTLHEGSVWLIAGPAQDAGKPFRLLRFPVTALVADGEIEPEFVADLPSDAEGLAILGASAIVVVDGNQPADGGTACRVDSTYSVVPLSPPRP